MKKIKFVIVGSGNIASTYCAAVAAIDGAEIVGVVSRSGNLPKNANENIAIVNSLDKITMEFDAIIVTCSPTHIPQPLKDQLAEGGRMIIPVGKYPYQNLVLLRKKRGKIKQETVLPVRFVPMLDEEGKKYYP